VTKEDDDYARAVRAAERELIAAASADDVRNTWRRHYGVLGHKALGRLLVGRRSHELIARKSAREDKD
jgi:hypothetical protein